ncbi:hypothetical protein P0136_08265 [Lentisphaerota bacterium ZTH]|nr:hypothetical protein JYG24_00625 [Lentisphaerota bacterium]WET05358.1 hypothetical protein P0136_08265 [Lentisphaerota bacterium ZTH]
MNKAQYDTLLSDITIFEKYRGQNHSAAKDLPIFKSLLSYCRNIEEIYRRGFDEQDGVVLGDELIRGYCASSVTPTTIKKIYTGIGADFVTDKKISAEVYRLNKYPSSFKKYIRERYYKVIRERKRAYDSFMTDNDDQVFVDMQNLEFKKALGVSAHPVTMYKGKKPLSGLYFGKTFEGESTPTDSGRFKRLFSKKVTHGTQEKERAVAEVFYAKAWRYLLGDQVSASLIMKENGKPVGICSKGLSDFIEYHHIIRSEEMRQESLYVPGLIAVTVLGYLLMEDDLHVMNLGWTNVNGKRVFGKIDHDYLCTRWENNWQQHELVKKFDISYMLRYVKNPSYDTLKAMMKRMRFSPGTHNVFLLRFGHSVRSSLSGKSNNTIGLEQKRYFKYQYVPHNKDELRETAYRLARVDVNDFYEKMRGHIKEIQELGINPSFAITILECIKNRLERIHIPTQKIYSGRRLAVSHRNYF